MSVDIYTGPGCGYCEQAKRLLTAKGLTYNEISGKENLDELLGRVEAAGRPRPQKVPQIFIEDEYIGGHDDLVKYFLQV